MGYEKHLELEQLKQFTDKLNEYLVGRLEYKGELDMIPAGATARTDWEDLRPALIGDTYRLVGTEPMIVDNITYKPGDYIFVKNECYDDTQVAPVEVLLLGGSVLTDGKTIIENEDEEYADKTAIMTAIGGWKETYGYKTIMERKITNDDATVLYLSGFAISEDIADGDTIEVYVQFPDGTFVSEDCTYSEADGQAVGTTFTADMVRSASGNLWYSDMTTTWDAGEYIVRYSVEQAADIENIHKSDASFINVENITTRVDDYGRLEARSAVEVEELPDVASTKEQVIYHLMSVYTDGAGVVYQPGYYTAKYNTTTSVMDWTRVGGDVRNAYQDINKINDYLYGVYYDEEDYDYAEDYFYNNRSPFAPAGCTVGANGRYVIRNFDWTYDESVEFVVRTEGVPGRYATLGVCGHINDLVKTFVASGDYSEKYKLVPFGIVDGINEKGLWVNTNIVNVTAGSEMTKTAGDYDIPSPMIPRYLLDHFDSATVAKDWFMNHAAVYNVKYMSDEDLEPHWFVKDENKCYVLEVINNVKYATELTDHQVMSNFLVATTTYNADGTVYTPNDVAAGHTPSTENNLRSIDIGLERHNFLVNNLPTIESIDDARAVANQLFYSNAYDGTRAAEDQYYSDYAGINSLTVDSPAADYEADSYVQAARAGWASRLRDGTYWQTCHSVVANLYDLSINVVSQENTATEYNFSLSSASKTKIDNLTIIESDGTDWANKGELRTQVGGYIAHEETAFSRSYSAMPIDDPGEKWWDVGILNIIDGTIIDFDIEITGSGNIKTYRGIFDAITHKSTLTAVDATTTPATIDFYYYNLGELQSTMGIETPWLETANTYDINIVATNDSNIIKSDARFIDVDNETTFIDDAIQLSAKSALEIEYLPTTARTEVMYRLTENWTDASGKKWNAGLYVYDDSDSTSPIWISVGGNIIDDKTIIVSDGTDWAEEGQLRTQVGGWLENSSSPIGTWNFYSAYSTYSKLYFECTGEGSSKDILYDKTVDITISNATTGETISVEDVSFVGQDTVIKDGYEFKIFSSQPYLTIETSNAFSSNTGWTCDIEENSGCIYHKSDARYVDIDEKTILLNNDNLKLETCIGGWTEPVNNYEWTETLSSSKADDWNIYFASSGLRNYVTINTPHEGTFTFADIDFGDPADEIGFARTIKLNDDWSFIFDSVNVVWKLHKETAYEDGEYFVQISPGTQFHKIDSRYIRVDGSSIYVDEHGELKAAEIEMVNPDEKTIIVNADNELETVVGGWIEDRTGTDITVFDNTKEIAPGVTSVVLGEYSSLRQMIPDGADCSIYVDGNTYLGTVENTLSCRLMCNPYVINILNDDVGTTTFSRLDGAILNTTDIAETWTIRAKASGGEVIHKSDARFIDIDEVTTVLDENNKLKAESGIRVVDLNFVGKDNVLYYLTEDWNDGTTDWKKGLYSYDSDSLEWIPTATAATIDNKTIIVSDGTDWANAGELRTQVGGYIGTAPGYASAVTPGSATEVGAVQLRYINGFTYQDFVDSGKIFLKCNITISGNTIYQEKEYTLNPYYGYYVTEIKLDDGTVVEYFMFTSLGYLAVASLRDYSSTGITAFELVECDTIGEVPAYIKSDANFIDIDEVTTTLDENIKLKALSGIRISDLNFVGKENVLYYLTEDWDDGTTVWTSGLYSYDTNNLIWTATTAKSKEADELTIITNDVGKFETAVGGYLDQTHTSVYLARNSMSSASALWYDVPNGDTGTNYFGGKDFYFYIENAAESIGYEFLSVSMPDTQATVTAYDTAGNEWDVTIYSSQPYIKFEPIGHTLLNYHFTCEAGEITTTYIKSDPHFINNDNVTVVLDDLEQVKAKSAIEVSNLNFVGKNEVLYRLTARWTSGSTIYEPGLYVYGNSGWINMTPEQGVDIDNKTIIANNDTTYAVDGALMTQVGGWKETTEATQQTSGRNCDSGKVDFDSGDCNVVAGFDLTLSLSLTSGAYPDFTYTISEWPESNSYIIPTPEGWPTDTTMYLDYNKPTFTLQSSAFTIGDSITYTLSSTGGTQYHKSDARYIDIDENTMYLTNDYKLASKGSGTEHFDATDVFSVIQTGSYVTVDSGDVFVSGSYGHMTACLKYYDSTLGQDDEIATIGEIVQFIYRGNINFGDGRTANVYTKDLVVPCSHVHTEGRTITESHSLLIGSLLSNHMQLDLKSITGSILNNSYITFECDIQVIQS